MATRRSAQNRSGAKANPMMAELHGRMPIILESEDWPTWLGEVEGDPAALLRPAADDVLKVWPISNRVNSA
jgi:putative SOS response-associated peptidase YedK